MLLNLLKLLASDQRCGLKTKLDVCRNILHEYSARIIEIKVLLLKSIAKSISLQEDSFLTQFGKRPLMYARFNYYPRCSRPDLVNGLRPHADGSGITFLLQDKEVEGLHMKKDNQWFQVPIMSHALLVNLGDQMEVTCGRNLCYFIYLITADSACI